MIIPEVEKTKSTSTTRLLKAQQRVDLANQGSWEEYLQDISIRWECKSDSCRYRNKGGICQVNQGIHYKIAKNQLNLQARKCKSGNKDGVSIQNPLLQIKHESAAISLKEVERGHMRLKQEEKKARSRGKSRSYSRSRLLPRSRHRYRPRRYRSRSRSRLRRQSRHQSRSRLRRRSRSQSRRRLRSRSRHQLKSPRPTSIVNIKKEKVKITI